MPVSEIPRYNIRVRQSYDFSLSVYFLPPIIYFVLPRSYLVLAVVLVVAGNRHEEETIIRKEWLEYQEQVAKSDLWVRLAWFDVTICLSFGVARLLMWSRWSDGWASQCVRRFGRRRDVRIWKCARLLNRSVEFYEAFNVFDV